MWHSTSLDHLRNAVGTYDRKTVERLCDDLIATLSTGAAVFPERDAKAILSLLRRKRFFVELRKVAEALLQSGQTSGIIQRQYAQALIESGDFTEAIELLEKLIAKSLDAPGEIAEANGLIGRALKEQYLNNPQNTPSQRRILNRALAVYYRVYQSGPSEYLWHGINAVALAKRALRDGVPLETTMDADQVALDILASLGRRTPDTLYAWDMATAAEACVALGRTEEAFDWLRQYVAADFVDAFDMASTLRQFRVVWCLADSAAGSDLLAVLETALLKLEGSSLSLSAPEFRSGVERLAARQHAFGRVFGEVGPVAYRWYLEGAARARSVGRVEHPVAGAVGTGFLVRAGDFFSWAKDGEILFITAAQVIGRTESSALAPSDALVRFEAVDPAATCRVKSLIWESPTGELDATIVSLENMPTGLEPLSLSPPEEPEFVEGIDRRFYVIGYPMGGSLAISLDDNMQVGWRRPLLHYRTPTAPGSSGSPVLDQSWRLVALHHAGSKHMPRLDGHAGTYEAKEGIWIHDIVRRTREISARDGRGSESVVLDPIPAMTSPTTERRGVFISYSHKDKRFLAELQTFLQPFVPAGEVQKWDDTDLVPGADWPTKIRQAIASCRVAILLVSQEYIASDFVSAEEFPSIIEAGASSGLTVFWIPLGPSTFHKTRLAELQAASDPFRPLNQLGKAQRSQVWFEIVSKIWTVIGSAPGHNPSDRTGAAR